MYLSDDSAEFSLSDDFDPDISDFEDPAHDQEILDLLFYKNSTGGKKQVINAEGHCPQSPINNESLIWRKLCEWVIELNGQFS